ncbi:lasso peptide biosynthesis B2 protein [Haliea sp. E17]|uniref:lasso peptide biosynthesis B2 protein n=1 Tax=Haliea sp. E17 TaxID=3401576 RepID=UPI003AAD5704
MGSPLKKFLALDWRSQLLAGRIWAMLGYYRAAILLSSFQRLSRQMQHAREEPPRVRCNAMQLARAGHLGYLVAATARTTPWQSNCLVQVLVLQQLLQREQIGGRLYLGACRDATSGEMLAHAWLRCGDTVVNGGGAHERFAVLSTYCWGEGDA